MAQTTKGFVKYSVIIIIMAVILGGCKKDGKDDDTTKPPTTDNSQTKSEVKPTPLPIDKSEAMEKFNAATANMNMEVIKIARTAKGWDSALAGYNGKDAPNMNLKDLDGNPISISSLKGKKAVIVKWTTMYEPSKQMVKTLAELQKQVGAENLAVIAFSTDDPAILKPVVESMDIPFPVAGRQGRMIDPYRTIRDTPVCFFIDKEGRIQLITVKVIPPGDLNSLVEAL
ncbi:MAG: peroxiredoxin family protein [Phycisphaerae bacterium]|nr:peroxiredoxin family protein [Phycisphaerae bacterium]